MVLHVTRIVFLLVVLAITISYAFIMERGVLQTANQGTITVFILLPVLLALGLVMIDAFWRNKRLHVLSGLFFGVLAGLAIGYILSFVVDLAVAILPAPEPASNPGPYHEWSLAQERAERLRLLELSPDMQERAIRIQWLKTISQAVGDLRLPSVPQADDGPRSSPPPGSAPAPLASTAPAPDATAGQDLEAERRSRKAAELEKQRRWDSLKSKYDDYVMYAKSVQMIKLLLGASSVFLCVTFVLQTKDDFRFVIPYVEFSKQTKGGHPLLLDTSAIIDGRIADIAETRILDGELLVPRFVLAELQAIADSEDKLKRNRGRRGLDVLNKLRSCSKIDIRVMDSRIVDDSPDVDSKLVSLARQLEGRVVTNDYNLNKIAQLRGVEVININDLANALKPIMLPGESLTIRILKPGEEPGQGVGYLEDGTMVVAEQSRDFIGREIAITVTSVLQTSAGRMIFGRLDGEKTPARRERAGGSASPAPSQSASADGLGR